MNEIKRKSSIISNSIKGELLKYCYKFRLYKCKKIGINTTNIRNEKIIISLTSYGRRVENTVYITISSLLRQTCKPDLVILWLDDSWKNRIIPKNLKRLIPYGLTIKYCKDLKSYKKLIPTLLEYPEATIITVDDDVYYKKYFIENLIIGHEKNPNKIICNCAHNPTFDINGKLLPYKDWKHDVSNIDDIRIFPVGVGGVLYRKDYLHKDVCDENLFMNLAPKADDIWFYYMGILNNTGHVVLPQSSNIFYPIDNFYQIFHKNSNLSGDNCGNSMNDIQIKNVRKYYSIENA